MEGKDSKRKWTDLSVSFKAGAVALAFLIIGYQVALFVRQASVSRIVANRDCPDTVFVYVDATGNGYASPPAGDDRYPELSGPDIHGNDSPPGKPEGVHAGGIVHRSSPHSADADRIYRQNAARRYESFAFDPNTVSVDELMRLGFSEKQALSIDSYRRKGGRFRRASDFAKSYVVSDTLFARLEPYIDIPLLDINAADSAAFDALPGIGPYYAARMVSYREELRGYSYPEQLMDIWKFDSVKFNALKDLIRVGPAEPYPLWTLPEDSLKLHPYIRSYAAHGIVLFRENTPRSQWSVEALAGAGILPSEQARRLSGCRIEDPE